MRTSLLACLIWLCPVTTIFAQVSRVVEAEDLWGNRIKFDKIIHSAHPTVIQPFSASNCGYCLFDGFFVGKNFFETNKRKGGTNFTQSLFNPQLDLYAFTKHYRDSVTPMLTYPPELHEYHRDGFPAILAFRRGEQIVKIPEGSLFPYDSTFDLLKMTLWNDTSVRFQPVSDLQFATRIIYENCRNAAVCVVPDGDTAGFGRNHRFGALWKCFNVQYLSQVTKEEWKKNVLFEGKFPRMVFPKFVFGNNPFKLIGDSVLCFGPYRFGLDTIGLSACIPNPADPEKYMVMRIRGKEVEQGYFDNSVDYSIYSFDKITGSRRILIHGFFEKREGNRWSFSQSLCISNIRQARDCVGICPVPERKTYPEHPVTFAKPRWKSIPGGEEYIFGKGSCRFPSIATDGQGTAWVAWEENGDILLSSVDRKDPVQVAVEQDGSDSYNPLIAFSDGKLWIFYLNNRDGFYRLYGRFRDGASFSEPLLLSEKLPCDAVTPAVISSGADITLVWSCWRANLRYPYFRHIINGIADSVKPLKTLMSASVPGYVNAWFFSLAKDTTEEVWGAWNQHYPATLGICAGNLQEEPISVTTIDENPEESQNGGYPGAITDRENRRWVFWESAAWETPEGERQKILGSMYDRASRSWVSPVILPEDGKTVLNQTPQATLFPDGRLGVVWSGRARDHDWGLYLVFKDKTRWNGPIRLTSGKEPARAPKVVPDGKNGAWVAFHEGKGERMKCHVVRIY